MSAEDSRWEAGRVIGDHYRIEHFVDEGSAGEVYAAQNVWTGRSVALKRLHPKHRGHATVVERFLLEGRIGGRIDHPNIVQTLDMAQEPGDDSFFIVQEFLQGTVLRSLMDDEPRLPYREALDLCVPLMGALIAVHQHGIVHRDIKPENVIVADTGMGHRVPKLLDFGIAKVSRRQTLTQAGHLLGTVDYMAPEQVEGQKDVDRRVDVWALGVLLYELLTGTSPFVSQNAAASLTKILTVEPPSLHDIAPGVPRGISSAVMRALCKERQQRFESVQQFLEALLRWSVSSDDEVDRALVGRHRISLPAMVEQKLRDGVTTLMPSSMRASLVVPSHRSGQFRLPESLRELAALMNGESGPREAGDSEPPPSSSVDSTDAGDTMLESGSPARDQARLTEQMVHEAHACLQHHDFAGAIEVADRALAQVPEEPSRRADLMLVQAEACYWLGQFERHEVLVIEAISLAPPYESAWFRCMGELAECSSKLGVHDRLPDLAAELAEAQVPFSAAPDYVVACCRVGIALQRAGWPEQVEAVLGRLSPQMYDLAEDHSSVRAWLCMLRSELADHAGDHAHGLALTEDAVRAFQQDGDVRRACVYRVDIGNAAMLLGDYETAEDLLRSSLQEAGSMRLAGASSMRLNLGITLTRLGRMEEGHELITRALRAYVRQGEWRGECAARVYLAEVLWMNGDRQGAEREALAAVERAQVSPVLQAEALGMLSLMQQDRPMESFMAASQAMELLSSVGGVAEGEARIRLAYALALDTLGHRVTAAQAYSEACDRLMKRASRISDDKLRQSFLHQVPDHARTLQLAESRGARSA